MLDPETRKLLDDLYRNIQTRSRCGCVDRVKACEMLARIDAFISAADGEPVQRPTSYPEEDRMADEARERAADPDRPAGWNF